MAQPGSNGFQAANRWVKEIEGKLAEKLSIKMENASRQKRVQEDIDRCYEAARGEGIPIKELKAAIKVRELDRKKEAIRSGLGDDGAETFDQIRHALGDLADLPLGTAALDRANAVDSLVTDEFEAADPNKVAANSNASKIAEGIKPLH